MLNIIQFFRRYHAVALFILLQSISFALLFSSSKYHESFYVNSANAVAGKFYSAVAEVRDYFNLKSENEKLSMENKILHEQLRNSFSADSFTAKNLNDTIWHQAYRYINAKVINVTTNQFLNYITINRGKKSGIENGMAVIGPEGVIGKVKEVSENFAVILPLIHRDSRLSARLKSNHYLGTITWDGNNPSEANLTDISKQVKVLKGDTIITSGASTAFPEGIVVGYVISATARTGNSFFDIRVRLATDFSSVTHVDVVNYLFRAEQETLENTQEHDGH